MPLKISFTLFVGRGVFAGIEDAPLGSDALMRYNIGVRVGSWGLAIAAASDVITSLVLSPITRVIRLKNCVYVDLDFVCHLNGCDDGLPSC